MLSSSPVVPAAPLFNNRALNASEFVSTALGTIHGLLRLSLIVRKMCTTLKKRAECVFKTAVLFRVARRTLRRVTGCGNDVVGVSGQQVSPNS